MTHAIGEETQETQGFSEWGNFSVNSYRNLVSCCVEFNSWKGAHPATDFLRWLYRQDRLTAVELTQRFRALKRLAAGKLRPRIS